MRQNVRRVYPQTGEAVLLGAGLKINIPASGLRADDAVCIAVQEAARKQRPGMAAQQHTDVRDRYIAQAVAGKSFVDVGGLYEIVKEKVSVARSHGATKLALVDVEPFACPWWEDMRAHLASKGIRDCEFISGDVQSIAVPPYDVVYSSGILYHAPSPLAYLNALRKITREHLILASTVLPACIPGRSDLRFAPGTVLYLPATPQNHRQQVSSFFAQYGRPDIFADGEHPMTNHYGTWWLPTKEALLAMCQGVGFEVLEDSAIESDSALGYSALLRPRRS
jgi:hypothetical protein